MCGRYIIRMEQKSLEEWAVHGPPEWLMVSYNVAPTENVPVVRIRKAKREGVLLRWGLIPFFAHGEPPKYSTINAMIENLDSAPAWRGPWNRGQRCIMPASGFYEWHLRADGRKVPFLIRVVDQEQFGFAALWDRSFKPDGTAVESCALITMPGNELMREIHNTGRRPYRMPAILRREDREAWLSGTAQEARGALVQYPSDLMVAHRVSTRVNSPDVKDESLIEPVPEAS